MAEDGPIHVVFLFSDISVDNISQRIIEPLIENSSVDRAGAVDFTDKGTPISYDVSFKDFLIHMDTYPVEGDRTSGWVPDDIPVIKLQVDVDRIRWSDTPAEQTNKLLDRIETIYDAFPRKPAYSYCVDNARTDPMYDLPMSASHFENGEIKNTSWLMLFSPEWANEYGREHLLSAPAWQVRELDDGAVMLVAFDSPVGGDPLQELSEYLGITDPDAQFRPD